jgi:mRNA interferase MazF
VVKRGDVVLADLGEPAGRRPVCIVTRDAAIEVLTAVTCAPITRAIRGIRSEVEVGSAEGLPEISVITCANLVTIPKSVIDDQVLGQLGLVKRASLDQALRYALDIQY